MYVSVSLSFFLLHVYRRGEEEEEGEIRTATDKQSYNSRGKNTLY